MRNAKNSVTSTPTSAERPPLVAPCWLRPTAPRMPPTMAPTMPLRMRLAPRAESQPRITLTQLVPSWLSLRRRSSSCSRRASPTLRGPESVLPLSLSFVPLRPVVYLDVFLAQTHLDDLSYY